MKLLGEHCQAIFAPDKSWLSPPNLASGLGHGSKGPEFLTKQCLLPQESGRHMASCPHRLIPEHSPQLFVTCQEPLRVGCILEIPPRNFLWFWAETPGDTFGANFLSLHSAKMQACPVRERRGRQCWGWPGACYSRKPCPVSLDPLARKSSLCLLTDSSPGKATNRPSTAPAAWPGAAVTVTQMPWCGRKLAFYIGAAFASGRWHPGEGHSCHPGFC